MGPGHAASPRPGNGSHQRSLPSRFPSASMSGRNQTVFPRGEVEELLREPRRGNNDKPRIMLERRRDHVARVRI